MLLPPGPKASTQVNGIGGQLALVGFLIVLNAAFAGSEIALISLREGQFARLEQRSARGRMLATLARQPNRFLSTIQIGITLAGFLAAATAAVALAERWSNRWVSWAGLPDRRRSSRSRSG
jgi:putative hemolysin